MDSDDISYTTVTNDGFSAPNSQIRIAKIILDRSVTMIFTAELYKDADATVPFRTVTLQAPYDLYDGFPIKQAQQWLLDRNFFPGATMQD